MSKSQHKRRQAIKNKSKVARTVIPSTNVAGTTAPAQGAYASPARASSAPAPVIRSTRGSAQMAPVNISKELKRVGILTAIILIILFVLSRVLI